MKVTRPFIKDLREKLQAVVDEYAKEHNYKIDVGNARYTESTVTFKLEVIVPNEDGVIESKYAIDFERNKRWLGMDHLKPGDKINMSGGTTFTLLGFNPSARKNKIVIGGTNGKEFVTTVETVLFHNPQPVKS